MFKMDLVKRLPSVKTALIAAEPNLYSKIWIDAYWHLTLVIISREIHC